MSEQSIPVQVRLTNKRDAGMMLHEVVGTVGPKNGPQATMIRNFGTGMHWHVSCGDVVAVIDLRDLLTEAARLVLEAAE